VVEIAEALVIQRLELEQVATAVVLLVHGVSRHDAPGGIFHDPEGREALAESLKQYIVPKVEGVEIDANINDPAFSQAVMALSDKMM